MKNIKPVIEQLAVFKNHFYAVKINPIGFRNGYVKIINSEVYNKLRNEFLEKHILPIECYGGINFVENIAEDNGFLPPGNWIGFDCAHSEDLPDIEYAKKLFNLSKEEVSHVKQVFTTGQIRSVNYVSNQCFDVIEQLIEKYADFELIKGV